MRGLSKALPTFILNHLAWLLVREDEESQTAAGMAPVGQKSPFRWDFGSG